MIIAVLAKRGEDIKGAVFRVIKELHPGHSGNFRVVTKTRRTVEKDADSLQSRRIKSEVAVGYTFPKTLLHDEPPSAKIGNGTLVFRGRIYSLARNFSVAEFVANKLKPSNHTAYEALFDEVEGDFAFIIAKPERIIAGRAPMGVQPLYYGKNRGIAALATNRKALWQIGIEKPQSFPPGHFAVVTREGFRFNPVRTLRFSKKPRSITIQEAARTLQQLLEKSIRKRIRGLQEVAVAFSGGLDSSVVAFLTKKSRVNVQLIHVSLENQDETEEAKRAADEMKLPIQIHLFKEEDVEKAVAKVVELIEEPDPVNAAVGVPFHWTAEKTAEAGFEVLLGGQGADELFGGYQRYINEYLAHGKQQVTRTMFKDAVRLHESNIERDMKICGFNGVELRLPFASYAVADFALSLPLELKIERKVDSLRKLVLRKVAENMGLPATIAKKPKRALQYSTGINDALKKIAKRQKLTVNEYVNKLFLKIAQP